MGPEEAQLEAVYGLEQRLELAAVTSDEGDSSRQATIDPTDTPWDSFSNEIDAWARHALAANGFGDY